MSFITNFQSPRDLFELIYCFCLKGVKSNIDWLLNYRESEHLYWSVDKNTSINDTIFFMCAVTSKDHIAHVCKEARELGKENLIGYAFEQREKYEKYAGNIVALGKAATNPQRDEDESRRYSAEVNNIQLLASPVHIDRFRDFITVSRTGTITKLTDEQCAKLLGIINESNNLEEQINLLRK